MKGRGSSNEERDVCYRREDLLHLYRGENWAILDTFAFLSMFMKKRVRC